MIFISYIWDCLFGYFSNHYFKMVLIRFNDVRRREFQVNQLYRCGQINLFSIYISLIDWAFFVFIG